MLGAQEQARINSVETETNKNKSSSFDVFVTCDDMRRFVQLRNCFGIKLVFCNLYLTRFDLTKDLLCDTFLIAVFNKLCFYHSVFEFESF